MILYPAIDLKDGACVRLLKGDFGTAHRVAEDPLAVAEDFYAAGARYLHMVDLDGALSGAGKNREVVRAVCAALKGRVKVELGGGIRCMADLEAAFSLGVWRAVLGSAAVRDPEFLAQALKAYPKRIAVGVDARDGEVMTAGWTEGSGMHYLDFAKKAEALGAGTLIFTDIATDGALQGPNLGALKELRQAVRCQIVASGGVKDLGDITALRDLGADGAIVGKAYYAGTLDLREAVREGGSQCLPNE